MQTSLMFVDLKPLGITPNSQKIAIKMPEGAEGFGVNGDSAFSDMINALMAITPEQLQNSFGEMEWVKVQGESTGYAPLLDLSAAHASGADMAQMLFGEIVPNNSQSSQPMGLSPGSMGHPDPSGVGFKVPQDPNPTKGAIPPSLLNSTTEGLPQSGLGSAEGEELGDIQAMLNKPGQGRQLPDRSQPAPSHVPVPTGDDAGQKSSLNDNPLIKKNASASTGVKVPSENTGLNPKDLAAATRLPEEMTNRSVKPGDPGAGRVTAFQNDAKVNITDEQATDQQFEDRNGRGAEHLLKRVSGERQPSEAVRPYFNVLQGEGSTGMPNDGTDPLSSDKQDHKALFHQVVSRMKGAPVKSVEYVSGHHEPAPQTSDTQSNVIRQIVQRMSLHNHGAQSTLNLKLKPAFLGNVHMQISTDNQQVVVRMATESVAVKEMVEQGLQHLKTEMQQHGLQIDKFDVYVTQDNEESHPGQDLAGFRQALKQRQQNATKKDADSSSEELNEVSGKEVESRRVTDNTSEIDYFA